LFVRPVACIVIVFVALRPVAFADDVDTAVDDATLDDLSVRAGSLFHDPGEPVLQLDLVPRPHLVGLGVTEDTARRAISLGSATITLTGTSWKGFADAVPLDGNERDIARGSRAAIGFRYDLGWAQVDAEVSHNVLSSRYGSGSYRDMSLAISKSHRFSRWVTGWLALSIGNRRWDGVPPDGEAESSTTLMLMLGFTFR
jgi:hypothetical protein